MGGWTWREKPRCSSTQGHSDNPHVRSPLPVQRTRKTALPGGHDCMPSPEDRSLPFIPLPCQLPVLFSDTESYLLPIRYLSFWTEFLVMSISKVWLFLFHKCFPCGERWPYAGSCPLSRPRFLCFHLLWAQFGHPGAVPEQPRDSLTHSSPLRQDPAGQLVSL